MQSEETSGVANTSVAANWLHSYAGNSTAAVLETPDRGFGLEAVAATKTPPVGSTLGQGPPSEPVEHEATAPLRNEDNYKQGRPSADIFGRHVSQNKANSGAIGMAASLRPCGCSAGGLPSLPWEGPPQPIRVLHQPHVNGETKPSLHSSDRAPLQSDGIFWFSGKDVTVANGAPAVAAVAPRVSGSTIITVRNNEPPELEVSSGHGKAVEKFTDGDKNGAYQSFPQDDNEQLVPQLDEEDERDTLNLPGPSHDTPRNVTCPTPGCDGSGHARGFYTHHRSLSGCPRVAKDMRKMPAPTCPTPGCDGTGHVCSGRYTHRTASSCPIAAREKAQTEAENLGQCPPACPFQQRSGVLCAGARAVPFRDPVTLIEGYYIECEHVPPVADLN
ncbi:hypothetical protein HPB48_003198 [Haemaphysalis longicornis]|uniref:Myelin transcription factor 1 n=1 Tax=Haemaphysalis longicornis TaxID=44386 RepID=A0A9J6GKG0_HAELO|nr:hypothetical protein HPB48_003198 [Haemaphysalis longicornis]